MCVFHDTVNSQYWQVSLISRAPLVLYADNREHCESINGVTSEPLFVFVYFCLLALCEREYSSIGYVISAVLS